MYEFIKTEMGWQVCWGPLPVPVAQVTEDSETSEEGPEAAELLLRRRAHGQHTARRTAAVRSRRELVLS
jgi:hypothetical protein